MSPLSQEKESDYLGDEDLREAAWSQEAGQTEHWVSGWLIPVGSGCVVKDSLCPEDPPCASPLQGDPRPKRPAQSLAARRNFTRGRNRPGQRARRNANNSKESVHSILGSFRPRVRRRTRAHSVISMCSRRSMVRKGDSSEAKLLDRKRECFYTCESSLLIS